MTASQPIQILHVDDEPGYAEMVAQFLEREDDYFTVHTATTTDDGLDHLEAAEIDCIVSDYDMPDRTGVEFLEAVRETHPDLPFVLFTGKGSEEVASHAISAGVTDYLQKERGSSQYAILANRIRNAVTRRRALREQEANERRFEAVFEDPGMLVGILDANGRVERINETAMQFIDADHESVRDTPFWRTAWWDDANRSDVEAWIERAAAGEYVSFDADLTRPNGDPYSVSGTIRPVTDDGDVVSLIVSATEITERRRRQRELDEEQTFISQALDTLDDAFYVIGTDGSIERWNDSLREVTGYSDAEIREMHVTEFFSDEDGERILKAVANVMETGKATVQADVVTADGTQRPYELTGARLTDPDGNLVGLVGVGRDVSGRKEREREIERVRDLLEKTERIADVGGWEIDTETMDVFWTEHLFDLLEVDFEEEPPLDGALDVYHEDDRPIVANAVEEALATGDPFDVEARFRTPAGEVRWLRIQGMPEVVDGDVVTLRGAVQDITDRKQDERELERQNARLEEFASVVSHDLRNPLNAADGFLELACEECESQHLDSVADAHDRMDQLIEDLLALARGGQDVREVEAVALTDLVESCWAHVATADATLDVTVDGVIRADRSQLRQLVENVMRNAVEHGSTSSPSRTPENAVENDSTSSPSHTPENAVENDSTSSPSHTPENAVEHDGDDITVRVGELADGFYVEDDGAGIPEDERERVFERGYSTSADGTGFGLSIVEEIADAHGWDVRVTEGTHGGARIELAGVQFTD